MQARRAVVDWAQRHVEDRAVLSDIALAVTEAATNVVLHAYRDRDVPGAMIIEAERVDDHVCLYVRDEGTGLAPRVDSPGLGLGLGLIAQVADSADVRAPESGGTEVVMRFNLARLPAT
jgi:serine/threonine-protein kinase RsbW/stage II sporulation protein AB (anti-sigma F factor)